MFPYILFPFNFTFILTLYATIICSIYPFVHSTIHLLLSVEPLRKLLNYFILLSTIILPLLIHTFKVFFYIPLPQMIINNWCSCIFHQSFNFITCSVHSFVYQTINKQFSYLLICGFLINLFSASCSFPCYFSLWSFSQSFLIKELA